MTYELLINIKKTFGLILACGVAMGLFYRGFTFFDPSCDSMLIPLTYGLAGITLACAALGMAFRTEEAQ